MADKDIHCWATGGHVRSDDEKRVIASTMLERIESMPRVAAATAPVFCLDRLEKPQFFASAVLININNWYFALTAGHVLDERSISNLYIGSGDKVVLLQGSYGSNNRGSDQGNILI